MKRILTAGTVLTALMIILSGCQIDVPDYKEDVYEYAMICEDGNLAVLEEYPNLKYVDLRGSSCYDEISTYAEAHPDVTVRYNVQLGDKRFSADVTEIELHCYETNFDILLQNLKFLKNLKHLHINQLSFTKEQVNSLIEAYPSISITYNVEICGRLFEQNATEIDLSHMLPEEVAQVKQALPLLPELKLVALVDSYNQSKLEIADAKVLIDAFPKIAFHYEFRLFGQTVSTLSEEIIFDGVKIGNDGIDEIRKALDVLTRCTNFRLDSCGIDNEIMAQLRSDYPDKSIVWRVFTDHYSILTDEEMLRMHNLTDEEADVLKYCTEVKYLDISNTKITNLDFVSQMSNLECAVLTLTRVSDLMPLANCPDLVWLELCGCTGVDDLSHLSGLANLRYLNIAATRVNNLNPLDSLKIERLNCVKSAVRNSTLEAFIEKHPDCLTVSMGSTLGYGWRYNDINQSSPFSYYEKMCEVFRYNDQNFRGNTKE